MSDWVMWPFFSKSWLGRLGRRGPAIAEAARNQNSEWRTWLADALTKLRGGDPCQPEAAVRRLHSLSVIDLLSLDDELRRAARFLDVETRRQNFVLSPLAQ